MYSIRPLQYLCQGCPQIQCFPKEDSQYLAYRHSHSYALLQLKDTKQTQQRDKAHGTKSRGNQTQASKCPLSKKSQNAGV